MKTLMLICLVSFHMFISAECIHQGIVTGTKLVQLSGDNEIWVKNNKEQYLKLIDVASVEPSRLYNIQYRDKNLQQSFSNSNDYNDKYLEYYSVARLKHFLKLKEKTLNSKGYRVSMVGQSIKGESLFYVGPDKLDYNKKTIVMFGRHHGDEGTANWIIEGFFNKFFHTDHLLEKYNLLLYPMINPDGANARVRYNANGRDLNRSWGPEGSKSYDEITSIYSHLEKQFTKIKRPVIVLDMHGSFTRDFIYRVEKSFKGVGFYNLQQQFISHLSQRDKWQNGNFILSNGDSGMSRIRLINRFGLNAMTHETPRDIPIDNRRERSVKSLMNQGVVIAHTIDELY